MFPAPAVSIYSIFDPLKATIKFVTNLALASGSALHGAPLAEEGVFTCIGFVGDRGAVAFHARWAATARTGRHLLGMMMRLVAPGLSHIELNRHHAGGNNSNVQTVLDARLGSSYCYNIANTAVVQTIHVKKKTSNNKKKGSHSLRKSKNTLFFCLVCAFTSNKIRNIGKQTLILLFVIFLK